MREIVIHRTVSHELRIVSPEDDALKAEIQALKQALDTPPRQWAYLPGTMTLRVIYNGEAEVEDKDSEGEPLSFCPASLTEVAQLCHSCQKSGIRSHESWLPAATRSSPRLSRSGPTS